jgi:hypothetical protein
MITFHSRQSDCAWSACKNENTGTFNLTSQIAPSICTVAFTKREKSDATIFTSRCSRLSLICNFRHGHALPLTKVRFFQLASSSPMVQRSPARRSSGDRKTSGKTSGGTSRAVSAQIPGNGRAVAAAMPTNVRQDDSQDNLPCAGHGHAMSAPETCETTRNTVVQQPCRSLRNSQDNISRAAC